MEWFFSEILVLTAVVGGFVAAIVAIVLFSRIDGLDRRVAVIERERTREVAASFVPTKPKAERPSEPRLAPEPAISRASEEGIVRDVEVVKPVVAASDSTSVNEDVTRAQERAEEVAAERAEAFAAPRAAKFDWEVFAGGRFFNFVGAIVLIIGVGLFMKYAFDSNWIGAPLRVLAGIFAGSIALVGGALTHEKRKAQGRTWFAKGVLGAGLGILYVSGYTAFQSYHLVSFAPAFAFVSLVTIVAFAIAHRYGSVAMALIGWAGGFVTPFAMGMANVDETSLAGYIVFLDAGLAALVLVRRQWFALQPLAVCASYLIALYWYLTYGANASATVSTLALSSIWFVFFATSVATALRESAADAPLAIVTRVSVECVNALALWASTCVLLAGDRPRFACVEAAAAIGYALAYAIVVRRLPIRGMLRAEYLTGSAVFAIGAAVTYYPHAELTSIFAGAAIGAGFVALRLHRRAPLASHEAAFAAIGLYATCGIAILASPSLMLDSMSWSFGFGSRDLSLVTFAAVGFALDRLLRQALPSEALGIALRQIGLVTIVAIEASHATGVALSQWLVATGIALALVHRVSRAIGTGYAPKREAFFASIGLLVLAANALLATSALFTPAYGAFDASVHSRDVAIAFFSLAAFAIDRILRDAGSSRLTGMALRVFGAIGVVALETLHAHDLGLATVIAITSIAVLAIDRTLRSIGNAYASESEVAYTATALLAAAWCAALAAIDHQSYAGFGIYVGFGKADSTLAVLIAGGIVLVRVSGRVLPRVTPAIVRQSVVLALTLAAIEHATGLTLCATLAIEALGYAIVGTRNLWRDLEIVGLGGFAIALTGALFEPAAWQAKNLADFAIFHDERALAFAIIATASILAGESYRRRSLLAPCFGRVLRLAGAGTIVFALTGELRDAFERAVLLATPGASETIAQIHDGEGLAVSGLWILASIVTIVLGVRLKLKDFRIAAIALFDLTILKAFFIDLGTLAAPYRILSFIGLGLTLLAVSYFYQRLEYGRTIDASLGPRGRREVAGAL